MQRPPPTPLKTCYYSDDIDNQEIDEGTKLIKLLTHEEAYEARKRLREYKTIAIWNGTSYCSKRRMAPLQEDGPNLILQQKIVDKLTEMGKLNERTLTTATTQLFTR